MNQATFGCLFFVFFASCGKDHKEKVSSAIEEALSYLSIRDCSRALEQLLSYPADSNNALYYQTLSSAYACFAGFDEPSFYLTNIPLIQGTTSSFISSLTRLTTSSMPTATDSKYLYLQQALNTLLYAGGITTPASSSRLSKYGNRNGGNINAQLLYMQLAQLGKYMNHYGNTNAAGVKGAGGGGTTCLYTYTQTDALTLIGLGITGSCTFAANTGHPDLTGVAHTLRVKRMCEAVVLFNNFLDTFTGTLIASSGGQLVGFASTFQTAVNTLCTTYGVTGICTVTDQTTCETDYATIPGSAAAQTGFNLLQMYFAAIFETLFQ